MIMDCCSAIEGLDHQVAGYAVVAWDDTGHTSLAFHSGGPISLGGVAAHVGTRIALATQLRLSSQQ